MTSRRSHAIVLKVSTHGEADKIITLYSPDLGRVTAIAKGAERSRKRFVNKLEPFTLLHILYRPPTRGSLFFLSEAELINPCLSLRTDYDLYVTATFINELIQRFTGELDPDPSVYTLLEWALTSLDRGMVPAKTATLFLLRLLNLCGYQPQLNRCASCRRPIEESPTFTLHPGNGTLLCSRCQTARASSPLTLSLQALKFLHSAQKLELQKLNRLQLPKAASLHVLGVLYTYTRYLFQQDIHSWKQLRQRLGDGNLQRSSSLAPGS